MGAINLSTPEIYIEDTPLNLADIVIDNSVTATATLTLSDAAAGALSTGTSGVVTSTYDSATGIWSASGAIADVNALLAAVTFTPAENFNGSFVIATSVSDDTGTATGSKLITGTAVNDAPVAVDDNYHHRGHAAHRPGPRDSRQRQRRGRRRTHRIRADCPREWHCDARHRHWRVRLHPCGQFQRHGQLHLPGQ
jgi:hypothetical protein